MKLENQVCSLELAKKLKELGVKQESLFFYANSPENKFQLYPLFFSPEESGTVRMDEKQKEYSAFTVAELGEMLPNYIISHRYGTGNVWTIFQRYKEDVEFHANTEADARAKMLIYLLENKLITL